MKRQILITNDDSINAKGIKEIADFMRGFGDVTVVAPQTPQSARSAALSIGQALRLTRHEAACFKASSGRGSIEVYDFNGTPTDCTKVGMKLFIDKGMMPDLLVSGVNHGTNASIASMYSGTLGAAAEAAVYGVPSIGLSICTHIPDADFTAVKHFTRIILEQFFANPPSKGIYLNINFPNIPQEQIKGIRMAHQGNGRWINEYTVTKDPYGNLAYWMVGEFVNQEEDPGSDADHLLNNEGWVTIVPHTIDTTSYSEKERLEKLWKF
ncbi:MAG: 5'/3'-nucleotidase SurE [Bacteroidales bacterium]|nr:5'/3'-nucleotidase SurE [Bacteroidales bacterium]